ncbi:MAG: hypothetical protein DRO88_08345 [Promethearchaeia archaeon]|nr:MAG: hypothetical protein DRO88_08345 [Candidatus Lokiarchaeia archaeon]
MLTKPQQATRNTASFKEDKEILENLASYVENFENFQSGKELKKAKKEKLERKNALKNIEKFSPNQLQKLSKPELVKLIFQANCQFVDNFFRKDYYDNLIKLSREKLKNMVINIKRQAEYLLL